MCVCVCVSCEADYVFHAVPAQPSEFEAEAELDTRIMLRWLWPVQDQIIKYELTYWEADSGHKVYRHTVFSFELEFPF